MSGWIPMDIQTDIMRVMAEQQGIELPPPASATTAAATAGPPGPRSSRSSGSSGLSQQYLDSVDSEGELVSTRRRLIVPPAPDPEPEVEKNEDDLLYAEDAAVATGATSSAATAGSAALPITSSGLLGSQYIDEPLDSDQMENGVDHDDEDQGDEPIHETEESPASPAPVAAGQQIANQTAVNQEPQVIPLLDEDGDGEFLPVDEMEDTKQALPEPGPTFETEIPGLGSPVRDDSPADPVVESVVEDMGEDGDRVGEEEDDIRMHDDPVSANSMESPDGDSGSMEDDLSPVSGNHVASEEVKSVNPVVPESESPSARVTRSSAARVTTPVKSRISESPPVTGAIPPVKIRIVPVSSGTVTYQLSQNDPPPASAASASATSGKRVSKKLTTPEPTAHPIIVQKKSQSKSSPGDQNSSTSSFSGRKVSPATDNRKKKSQTSPPAAAEPCLNCGKASVANKMWDNEYCSHECVFFYVQKVFQQMYPAKAEPQATVDQKERSPATLKSST